MRPNRGVGTVNIELLVTDLARGVSQEFKSSLIDRLPLGRDSASPIQFEGARISRSHLDLLNINGRVFVQDLSINGSCVNGARTAKGSEHEIHDGDVIEIPGYRIEVSLPDEKLSAVSQPMNSYTNEARFRPGSLGVGYLLTHFLDPLETLIIVCAVCSFSVIALYFVL